jgi:outer membrane protein assembly factor BamB
MLQALKCPACAASLEAPKDGKPILRCPYCNTSIIQEGSSWVAAGTSMPASTRPASKLPLVVGLAIVGFVAGIVFLVRASIHSARESVPHVVVNVPTPAKPTTFPAATRPSRPIPPPPPPAFAKEVRSFGVEGVGPGRFQDAACIALDGLGHLYVGESHGGRIQVLDLDGKYLTGWNTGSVKRLLALAADRKGVVYANCAPSILRFDGLTGKPLGPLDDMNTDIEEFYRDIFCTVDGVLFSIGGYSHLIQFDADGKIKSTIRANDKVGEPVQLERILVQPTGEIYCVDHERGLFQFAADGRYINRVRLTRSGGRVVSPSALATDSKGRLYVSDANGGGIAVFDANGGYLDSFGKDSAAAIAISDDNRIFAAFPGRHVVREFAVEKK